MNNKLGFIAFFSLAVLVVTFIWSTHEVDEMFNLASLEVNQVEGPPRSRKKIDGFDASKMMKTSSYRQQMSGQDMAREIDALESVLNEISETCPSNIAAIFEGKDLIDPNGAYFKNFKNIDTGYTKLSNVLEDQLSNVFQIKVKIDELLAHQDLSKDDFSRLVQMLNHGDVCVSPEMDNFLMTSLESFALHPRHAREKKEFARLVKKLSMAFIKSRKSDTYMYKGVGLLMMANQHNLFENFDGDYVGELQVMLEERRDELQYQLENINDQARVSEFLEEENQWRKDFADEVYQYVAENSIDY